MRFFDFFSGIGGFRLGMEMAGHVCVGHCEIDKYANESYKAMHHPKESEVFFEDVRTIDAADMPECECYCFGFPCQAFSTAGLRNGFRDTSGYFLECPECEIETPIYDTLEEAIEKWNRRAGS